MSGPGSRWPKEIRAELLRIIERLDHYKTWLDEGARVSDVAEAMIDDVSSMKAMMSPHLAEHEAVVLELLDDLVRELHAKCLAKEARKKERGPPT